jgi:predicted HTH transcriptional regulator
MNPEEPMASLQPRDLLDALLEGTILSSNELKDFIRKYPDEDLLFDYKDGLLTKPEKRKEGSQIIRREISGFANSVGRVLIVGVNEDKPRGISPCERNIGGQTLTEWATRCLQNMVGFFSPPSRFQIVELDEGPVLTIAVARAPSLMWCVEDGRPKYFLRMGDSTVEAPDYLISDLVLGRRQHPIVNLHLSTIDDKNSGLMCNHCATCDILTA